MSRGPTRRVHRLIESGTVTDELLQAAVHQADLLGHPYIGVEHLELGRLRMEGRTVEYEALRQQLHVDLPRRWWRPRGPRSALRRRGQRQTESARLAADYDAPGRTSDELGWRVGRMIDPFGHEWEIGKPVVAWPPPCPPPQ
jgi:hypothetical protein